MASPPCRRQTPCPSPQSVPVPPPRPLSRLSLCPPRFFLSAPPPLPRCLPPPPPSLIPPSSLSDSLLPLRPPPPSIFSSSPPALLTHHPPSSSSPLLRLPPSLPPLTPPPSFSSSSPSPPYSLLSLPSLSSPPPLPPPPSFPPSSSPPLTLPSYPPLTPVSLSPLHLLLSPSPSFSSLSLPPPSSLSSPPPLFPLLSLPFSPLSLVREANSRGIRTTPAGRDRRLRQHRRQPRGGLRAPARRRSGRLLRRRPGARARRSPPGTAIAGAVTSVERCSTWACDVVSVCTPHPTHEEVVTAAAARGVHVLCEKPIAIDLASAGRMVAALETAGVMLGVLFQRRFWPAAQRIRAAIDDGTLGHAVPRTRLGAAAPRPSYYTAAPWRGTWATDGGGRADDPGRALHRPAAVVHGRLRRGDRRRTRR